MKFIIFMSVILFIASPTGATNIHAEYLGGYVDQIYGNGEMEGYGVDLYKQGSVIFGEFTEGGGLTIYGNNLYDIKLDQSTGNLSFKVKLSDGGICQDNTCSKQIPAHSIFVFSGHINHKSIIGKLRIIDGYKPLDKGMVHLIKLKRQDTPVDLRYNSLDELLAIHPPDQNNGWGSAN